MVSVLHAIAGEIKMTINAIRYAVERKRRLTGELSDVEKLQVQAYFCEYQAMITRMNWFMSLQFMPLVPLIAFFAFIVTAHSHFHLNLVLVEWGAVGVTQIGLLIYYFSLHEVYNHVLYVEKCLKPKVSVLLHLGTDSFWGWERHLKQFGKANDPAVGDCVPAALPLGAFIVAASIAVGRAPASEWTTAGWDCLGTVVTGYLLLRVVVLAGRVVKVRKEFEAVA
jgi:hypothetical protein